MDEHRQGVIEQGFPRVVHELVSDSDDLDSSASAITLLTLHTAKGLEFPTVFLTGMEEGIFPHNRTLGDKNELEEERRLAYVGLTRAQHRLYLSRSQYRTSWGAPTYNPESRFLGEIPEKFFYAYSIFIRPFR